jgi:uncharacterized protein (TIGR03437 family)
LPALTTLTDSFEISAGWPVALAVTVKDDCGNPLQSGSVTVSFSNGDQPISLQAQANGRWEGTWPTRVASTSDVTLKMHAENPELQLAGDQQVSGGLASQQQPPVFDATGVVGIFGGAAHTPLAPGGIISIFGDRLAESTAQSSSFPLPSLLEDTQVFMAGIKSPLYYVSQTQINAIVPHKIGVNVPQQLLVQRGLTYSLPLRVDLAPTQPEIINSGPPQFAGVIYAYPASGGSPYIVSVDAPTHAGDTIALYCSGLGAVSPEVPDGAAAGANSTTTNDVQLTIGDQAAQIVFQGLVPGYAGLYQVNAVVPTGVSPGAVVNVTIRAAGQISPPVTITIQ